MEKVKTRRKRQECIGIKGEKRDRRDWNIDIFGNKRLDRLEKEADFSAVRFSLWGAGIWVFALVKAGNVGAHDESWSGMPVYRIECFDKGRYWTGRWVDSACFGYCVENGGIFASALYQFIAYCSLRGGSSDRWKAKTKYRNAFCSAFAYGICGMAVLMKKWNVRKMCMKKIYIKGSLTVETACVMPIILLVLIGLLYLNFFVHNRAWLTAAAYEAALTGSMEAVKQHGYTYEAAQMRSRELGNIGFFGAENLSAQVNVGKKVQVTYDFDTISGFGGFSWHDRTEGTSEILQPAKWIRKARAASEIVTGG